MSFIRKTFGLLLFCSMSLSVAFAQGNTISILTGDGQLVEDSFLAPNPLAVKVTDAQGNNVNGATVTFTRTGLGQLVGGDSTTITTTTGSNGVAQVFFFGAVLQGIASFAQSQVTATLASTSQSVVFRVTTAGKDIQGTKQVAVQLIYPQLGNVIEGTAGQTGSTPIQVRVFGSAGFQANQGISGVALRIKADLDNDATITCAGGAAFTDASGYANCSPVFGGKVGSNRRFTIYIGGELPGADGSGVSYLVYGGQVFNVTRGPLAAFRITGGNNQSGAPGDRLPAPLVAVGEDLGGNVVPGAQVIWEPVVAGTVNLTNIVSTTDANGRTSASATLGSTAGVVQVRVRSATTSTIQATFNITVNVTLSGLDKLSGDNQEAIQNADFRDPLVVAVSSTSGIVNNVPVAWAVASGSATVSAASTSTDANGRTQVTVKAGPTVGPVVITAKTATFTQSFNLIVRRPGPIFSANSLFSAISGQPGGVSPGNLLQIYGSGFASGLQGCVLGQPYLGPLPYQVASVSVTFGTTPAPIYAVCNQGFGGEYLVVQVPAELAAGSTSITGAIGQSTTTIQNVQVVPASPAIAEWVQSDGRRRAVATRPDGSYVSISNPARKGEKISTYVFGLGQGVTPDGGRIGTNQLGSPGATTAFAITVGLNNEGVNNVDPIQLSTSILGAYVITFEVPATAPSGPNTVFSISASVADRPVFSNGSAIPIQ